MPMAMVADRDGREGRRTAKAAQGIAAILHQPFPPEAHVHGAHGFQGAQRTAELLLRQRARLFGIEALRTVPFLAQRLVAVDFFAPFGFPPAAGGEAAAEPLDEAFHAKRSTFRTPLETAVQLVSASARRRRPAGVKV